MCSGVGLVALGFWGLAKFKQLEKTTCCYFWIGTTVESAKYHETFSRLVQQAVKEKKLDKDTPLPPQETRFCATHAVEGTACHKANVDCIAIMAQQWVSKVAP